MTVRIVQRTHVELDNKALLAWLKQSLDHVVRLMGEGEGDPNIELTLEAKRVFAEERPIISQRPEFKRIRRLKTKRPRAKELQKLYDTLRVDGWEVTAKGWPDMFAYHPPTGSVACIMVDNHRGRRLRTHQHVILQALTNYGIPVYVFDPAPCRVA